MLRECERLVAENDEGFVEYKWRLVDVGENRFQHLVTQMKFRVGEGDGECIYEIGVEDNGTPRGLSTADYTESLATLRRMASTLGYSTQIMFERTVSTTPLLQCAEVLVRDARQRPCPYKVALLGPSGGGKTTLCGVLAQGLRDDGVGAARQTVFQHRHELETGHSSCVASRLVGFNVQGEPLSCDGGQCGAPTLDPTERCDATAMERSHTVVQLLDLPGRRKSRRTAIRALLSRAPAHAMLVIDGTADPATFDDDYFVLCGAAALPLSVVITHHDAIASANQLVALFGELQTKLRDFGLGGRCRFVEGSDSGSESDTDFIAEDREDQPIVPVFVVSTVSLHGVSALMHHLYVSARGVKNCRESDAFGSCSVEIRDASTVDAGTVLHGTVIHGRIRIGQHVALSPLGTLSPVDARIEAIRVAGGLLADYATSGADIALLIAGPDADSTKNWRPRGRQRSGVTMTDSRSPRMAMCVGAIIDPPNGSLPLPSAEPVFFLCGGTQVVARVEPRRCDGAISYRLTWEGWAVPRRRGMLCVLQGVSSGVLRVSRVRETIPADAAIDTSAAESCVGSGAMSVEAYSETAIRSDRSESPGHNAEPSTEDGL